MCSFSVDTPGSLSYCQKKTGVSRRRPARVICLAEKLRSVSGKVQPERLPETQISQSKTSIGEPIGNPTSDASGSYASSRSNPVFTASADVRLLVDHPATGLERWQRCGSSLCFYGSRSDEHIRRDARQRDRYVGSPPVVAVRAKPGRSAGDRSIRTAASAFRPPASYQNSFRAVLRGFRENLRIASASQQQGPRVGLTLTWLPHLISTSRYGFTHQSSKSTGVQVASVDFPRLDGRYGTMGGVPSILGYMTFRRISRGPPVVTRCASAGCCVSSSTAGSL